MPLSSSSPQEMPRRDKDHKAGQICINEMLST